jgi:crotonobetaine/carnitine-CoA ligase
MIDEEGFFFFLDRKKGYMRRGGENISSYEMEKTFAAHPQIEDCRAPCRVFRVVRG